MATHKEYVKGLGPINIGRIVEPDEPTVPLRSDIPSPFTLGPVLDRVASREISQELRGILADHLTPIEQQIIYTRYGLDTGKPRTLDDTGEELGMTKDRVHQQEQTVFRRLRREVPGLRKLKEDLGE